MLRPTLQDFELSESNYQAYLQLPKKIESRFMRLGAVLGALPLFILCLAKSTDWVLCFFAVLVGWTIGSIIFYVISVVLMNFLISRNKLHARVSLYEAALSAYQRTQERFWKSLRGREFERELGQLFALQGYHVDFTPASGDQGVDLILTKGNVTTIVQCKAHSKPIGPAIVRDLYGTLMASKARSAILASTQGFTKGVYSFSRGKRIELLSLQDIIRLSEEVGQRKTGKQIQKKSK
jgi:hypothetical protein